MPVHPEAQKAAHNDTTANKRNFLMKTFTREELRTRAKKLICHIRMAASLKAGLDQEDYCICEECMQWCEKKEKTKRNGRDVEIWIGWCALSGPPYDEHDYTRQEEIYHKDYCYGGATQALHCLPRKKGRYKEDLKAGTLTYPDGKLEVIIEKGGKPLADSTDRLLDALVLKHTDNNGLNCQDVKTSVNLSFDLYACWRGATSKLARHRLRQTLPDDLEILLNTHIRWQNENRKGKKRDVLNANILGSYVSMDKSADLIQVNFTQEFAWYVTHWFIGQYDVRLLALDARYAYARQLGKKLQQLYYSKELRETGNHNIIKVATLLEAIPDLLTYAEVKKSDRHYRRIIEPFGSNLDALKAAGILTNWQYLDPETKPMPDEQLKDMNHAAFIESYLKWEAPEPVCFTPYLESIAEK